ncbi:unnamed protein product [Staurois parvus]|uniref:Uncharacterized protein n=1 Tax=Staurois parvus TaxID=386267 RepID=A0ABN9B616_9NEOB|nr:unnamed protein product [Staurois parvus]
MGPCTASPCCCQARNLPWAPCTESPHAAARPVICHGPLYRLLMLLPGPECRVSWVPVRASPLLLSLSPHSAMCHFQVSSHCWWFPFFVIGCCNGLPLLLPPPPTLWLHTLVLRGPVTAQMSEVCGDSKIERHTHLHVILTDSIISLPPADSKGI